DGDGVQDSGEPGVADVLVELWDEAKTRRFDATTTNASGNYTLKARGTGNYRIWVLRPSPADSFSLKDAGSSDPTDSDINPDGPDFGFSDACHVPANLIATTTLDAGLKIATGARDLTPLRMTGIRRVMNTW